MAVYRTGGEIDSLCTKCRMTLAHTILAMVSGRPARVQCNTCGGQHAYRSATPAEATRRAAPSSSASQSRPRRAPVFEELLAKHSNAVGRTYSPRELYAVDELVVHPTFGRGVVSSVRADKIEVTFRGAVRTLIHGRR